VLPTKKKTAKKTDNISHNWVAEKQEHTPIPATNYASASRRQSTNDHLYMYSNPSYTDQELEWFEDVWSSSIAGAVIDKLIEYVFGNGIKPVFELINDAELDDDQKKEQLKMYEDELNELIEYDKKIRFEKKLKEAITNCMVFGRCVVAFEGRGLPRALKIIHPRDTGRVFINQKDWSLEKVITTFPSDEITPDDMLYLCNRPDSPKRRTMWYGYSDLQRVVGSARSWRRLIEADMPEVVSSMWAGYGMFLVKKMGRSKTDSQNDMNTLLQSLKAGSFNAVSVDASDEVEYHSLDLQPKIKEMVDLASFYERIIIGNFAVPSALMGREEDQNRATLIGKINFFLSGVVKAKRDWIADMVSQQWYERNMIKMGMGDLLDKVRVKTEFESIIVESWFDLVDSVLRIKGIFPNMPDDQLLELLNLEEFKSELAQSTTPTTDVPQGNVPINTAQDIVNKQINKTINQTDTVSAKKIDDEVIKTALDAKKLEVLDNLDKMIKDAGRKTKSNKKSS
jgi:hypothetical protein